MGTWRLASTVYVEGDPAGEPASADAFVLELNHDGVATIRENGVVTLQTRFRTLRDRSAQGTPLVIEFDQPVAGETRYGLPAGAANSLDLSCCGGDVVKRFVRV